VPRSRSPNGRSGPSPGRPGASPTARAYVSGGYPLAEMITHHFEVHYSTVSRAVATHEGDRGLNVALQDLTSSMMFVYLLQFYRVSEFNKHWEKVERMSQLIENKTVIVCGAGGFIGSHLVKRLKAEGFWVRGVDLKWPEFNPTVADDFVIGDLREPVVCGKLFDRPIDEVYQLAADMGGRGIFSLANMMPM
jgi:hypothetical protein